MAVSNVYTTTSNEVTYVKKKQTLDQTLNNRKTLYVSGLKRTVTTEDIRKHFTNCIKVTMKQHRTTPQLKYDRNISSVTITRSIFLFLDMLLFFTIHLYKLNSIFNDPLIIIFLVLNVASNMVEIDRFLVINRMFTQEKLWLVRYQ